MQLWRSVDVSVVLTTLSPRLFSKKLRKRRIRSSFNSAGGAKGVLVVILALAYYLEATPEQSVQQLPVN